MGVTSEVPLRLRVETGAADAELDLAGLRLAELRLRTGASETRVSLPTAAGVTVVDAEGGATTIRFRVPDGVAARIRSSVVLGSSDIDTMRFPRTAAGDAWESPGFAAARQPRRHLCSRRDRERLGAVKAAHAAAVSAPQPATRIPRRTRQSTATEPTVELAGRACG